MRDHEADCAASCEHFYCGTPGADAAPLPTVGTHSHSMGSVPPEDFAASFRFPLDLIRVTSEPIIDAEEAERVVATSIEEGIHSNEYTSGKYKLGGDWVKKMPRTLAWFNQRLEQTIFPAIAALFPEIVSSPSVLRAHSVAILKYNVSHPRTDVHVDDGTPCMCTVHVHVHVHVPVPVPVYVPVHVPVHVHVHVHVHGVCVVCGVWCVHLTTLLRPCPHPNQAFWQ